MAANKAKDYLVKKRGIEAERIVAVDGGSRQRPATELWIVPSGAEPLRQASTVKRDSAKPTSPNKIDLDGNLTASRQAANEVAAILSVQGIARAQITYSLNNGTGEFTDLAALGKERLIDSQLASGEKLGYLFTSKPIRAKTGPAMFDTTAKPKSIGTSGTRNRSFYSNETMIVYEAKGGEPPSATSVDRVPKNGSPIR